MRHNLVAWVMVPALWGQASWAQQPAAPAEPNDFKPASINIDGVSVADPASRSFFGSSSMQSGIERRSNPNIWNLHEALAKAGIKSVYYESPGTAHEWLTRRRHLRELAPLLFKD